MIRSEVHKPGTLKGMVISEVYKPDTFLFFAYGPNMLTLKIHMHCTSAEFVCMGRVENYRVDFMTYVKYWGGPMPTLVLTANAHVWGVIWRIHNDDLPNLEARPDLDTNKHYATHISVLTCYMGEFKCLTYIGRRAPLPRGNRDKVPLEMRPSRSMRRVMLLGAIEHKLPRYYIFSLWRRKHNGQKGLFELDCILRRYASNIMCDCDVGEKIYKPLLKKELPIYQKTLQAREKKKKDKSIKIAKLEMPKEGFKLKKLKPKKKIQL